MKDVFRIGSHFDQKRSELHGLSFHVLRSQGCKSCMFPFISDFVAKPQTSSIHDYRFEFIIPSLDDFMDGDRDKFLLCPMRSLTK